MEPARLDAFLRASAAALRTNLAAGNFESVHNDLALEKVRFEERLQVGCRTLYRFVPEP